MFTSRSMVELYQDCPRARYLNYHHKMVEGQEIGGIVGVNKSVPLVTGSAVHRGIEHLLNRVRIGQEPDVETAVQVAVHQYVNDVEECGFSGKEMKRDAQQLFTFNEQKALAEALIRVWFLVELPEIRKRYKVVAVERDIEPLPLGSDVWFMAKVDAEFREIGSNDYHNYSIKTAKSWGEREEASYKSDLQGLTEIWAVEEDTKRGNKIIENMTELLGQFDRQELFPQNELLKIGTWLNRKKIDKKVMGVRFCILIKGKRYKNPEYPESFLTTYSPLIRGYKNIGPMGVQYAHSWTFPNEANKSGMGKLGKGWEPFNVWETDFGVKGWIDYLATGCIQPECGDVLKQQVVTPVEYFRDEEEIRVAIEEIVEQEDKIQNGLMLIEDMIKRGADIRWLLSSYFPHVRKHCHFHFGEVCSYHDACWKPQVRDDLLGSGLYQIRTKHHEKEQK